MTHPIVGIVMGSDSDWPIMKACAETLKKFGVPHEAKVLSAHRTPDAALDYAEGAADRGMKILIGAAGGEMAPSQVEEALRRGADDIGERGTDEYFGRGRVNADQSL